MPAHACSVHGSTGGAVDVLRCECGKLLARVLKSVVELKCSRCKRVVLLVNGRRFEEAGAPSCHCVETLRVAKSET